VPSAADTDQSSGGSFGDRRVCLRRGHRNCSSYRRTIAAAGSSQEFWVRFAPDSPVEREGFDQI
jgi:hypothetical protein